MTIERGARQRMTAGQRAGASASVGAGGHHRMAIRHHFHVECFDRDGNLKWEDHFDNLVVNEGLNDYLDKYYNGSGYTATHYVGLTDSAPTFAGADTMSSHGGWTEFTEYQQDDVSPSADSRALYQPSAAASQSLDNSSNKAVFNIVDPGGTAGGAFITTDSTKGGTSGTLVGGNSFTGGDRTLSGGDTLNVTVTASMTSS